MKYNLCILLDIILCMALCIIIRTYTTQDGCNTIQYHTACRVRKALEENYLIGFGSVKQLGALNFQCYFRGFECIV